MKKIDLQIPDGKRAEWINGVLTLVDDVDKRPVTERVKTFEDACNELGEEHPLVKQYRIIAAQYKGRPMTEDFIAYLKLRIIVAALNEGWEPKFEKDEHRYFPRFYFYPKKQYDELDDEGKRHCVLSSGRMPILFLINNTYSYVGFAGCASSCSSVESARTGQLAFRTYELAEYAGKQFAEEWANFLFILGK